MSIVSQKSIREAVRHVARHGDTDVFPFPIEKHWFADAEDEVISLLENMDLNFDNFLAKYPIHSVKCLAGVGYNGFRAATQIDPLWDAYLLSLVLEISNDIEKGRIGRNAQIVFSYRYDPDTSSAALFDKDIGWRAFQLRALELAKSSGFILATDISDFYPRVYHHRLENALSNATSNKEAVKRISRLLFKLAGDTSYGLPIGGDASRILAEALLNRVDRLLRTAQISFLRFVDDYLIFAHTREDAQRALVILSDLLLRNEGMTLSRAKTRLMSAAEFRRASPLAEPHEADSEEEANKREFLGIKWRYDPYSPTADEDYGNLVEELEKFDVIELLAREFGKTRVDETLVRQIVKSIRFLSSEVQRQAVISIIDNLAPLYPVFPTVAIALRHLMQDLDQDIVAKLFLQLRGLLREGSHIMMVPVNMLYAVRLLAFDPNDESDVILSNIHNSPNSNELAKRDVIYAMTRRGAGYWISDIAKRYAQLNPWEQRAITVASYILGDEGNHWRKHKAQELSMVDRAFQGWVGRRNNGTLWEIPL